ncbi:MAG: hypothetical protein GXY56_05325 [Clostridiales bacterium]|nr:hypothetical protein [Clostridiales bacterium]
MNKSITPCEDGKLRWSYTLNLWRQPIMLYTAIPVLWDLSPQGRAFTHGLHRSGW